MKSWNLDLCVSILRPAWVWLRPALTCRLAMAVDRETDPGVSLFKSRGVKCWYYQHSCVCVLLFGRWAGAPVHLVSHWSDLLEHLGRAHGSNWNTRFADVTPAILEMLSICSALSSREKSIFMKCAGLLVTLSGPHHHDSQNRTPVITSTVFSELSANKSTQPE